MLGQRWHNARVTGILPEVMLAHGGVRVIMTASWRILLGLRWRNAMVSGILPVAMLALVVCSSSCHDI